MVKEIGESETVNKKSNNIKPQNLEAHYSVKGRAGKPVTIVKGFKGTKDQIKELAKMLKNICGVGGSIKNDEIIIQGKYREKITSILTDQGNLIWVNAPSKQPQTGIYARLAATNHYIASGFFTDARQIIKRHKLRVCRYGEIWCVG